MPTRIALTQIMGVSHLSAPTSYSEWLVGQVRGKPMQNFSGKIAVITGGGTGMGRELARALVAEGCDVALCDVSTKNMEETIALCKTNAPQGVRTTAFSCDVSNRKEMNAFADHVRTTFESSHINLLFNNAGIAGGGSFVAEGEQQWERTFNVCWGGVYNGSRAFLPMLTASQEGHIINTSSINGFWASAGPKAAHTAYSSAKFAVVPRQKATTVGAQ